MAGRYKAYDKLSSTREVIIEDFPEHWTLTRIKFNSLVKARVGWHGLKSDDFTEVGPYLVTGSDFKGKFIQWKNCYHCDEERYEQDPYIQLTNGDLLITKDGTIGKVALVSQLDGKATLNSGVFVVRPLRSDYTTQYYYWLLLSRSFTDFVDYYKTGSTIAHLYQETFVNFKYPLPPYEEQQKIAKFLDHETAKIDTLIAKQEKLIELLKEKRQAVISHAVTKGLNPNAPMRNSGVEWLGEVPEHWVVSSIKHVSSFVGTGGTPKNSSSFADKQEIKWFTPGDFNDDIEITEASKYITYDSVLSGDAKTYTKNSVLVIGIGATLGKVSFCKDSFSCNQQINVITPNNKVTVKFLAFSLLAQLEQMKLSSNASTIGIMNQEKTKAIQIAAPLLQEQKEVVSHIEQNLKRFEELNWQANLQIDLLKERKTALISAAVTGKIDVRDWKIGGS